MDVIEQIPVEIKCSECETIQTAWVQITFPWNTYIHTCEKCSYVIMESEWEEVKNKTQ